jgi:hypothetical protein
MQIIVPQRIPDASDPMAASDGSELASAGEESDPASGLLPPVPPVPMLPACPAAPVVLLPVPTALASVEDAPPPPTLDDVPIVVEPTPIVALTAVSEVPVPVVEFVVDVVVSPWNSSPPHATRSANRPSAHEIRG